MTQQDIWKNETADHLGDGVYVAFDGNGVWLHANDHINPTDRIYMEPEVIENFLQFLQRMGVEI